MYAYDPSQEVRLHEYQVTLEERLATLQSADDDILELIEYPDSIAAKVEESVDYRQDVHEILIRIENLFTSKVDIGKYRRRVYPENSTYGSPLKMPPACQSSHYLIFLEIL